MPEQKNDNDTVHLMLPGKSAPALLAVLAVLVGGYSTWEVRNLQSDPQARPDAWTATQAKEQAAQLQAAISENRSLYKDVEKRVDELEQCRATVYERLDRILGIVNELRRAQLRRHYPAPQKPTNFFDDGISTND